MREHKRRRNQLRKKGTDGRVGRGKGPPGRPRPRRRHPRKATDSPGGVRPIPGRRGSQGASTGSGHGGFQVFIRSVNGAVFTVHLKGPREPASALLTQVASRLRAQLGDFEGLSLNYGGRVLHEGHRDVLLEEWGIVANSTLWC